jgi:hypothetical protein
MYYDIVIARALINVLGMLIMRFGAKNAAQQRQSVSLFSLSACELHPKNMWCDKYHNISRLPNCKMHADMEFPTLPGSFNL